MSREVREALERLRPMLGDRVDALWAMALSGDRKARDDLERTLLLLDVSHNQTFPGRGPPPLPPPRPGLLDGWLRLGSVVYPNTPPAPFGLGKGELIQHVGVFGRSGAGKTNTVIGILRGLIERGVPFLVFDWKRNYRDILAAPWVPEGDVAAYTAGRDIAPLHFLNPLRPPPGTDPRVWLKKVIEILAHAYFLGEGVMFLLQEALDEAYRRNGIYEGSDRYPTFHDVHAILKSRKVTGREANWMASTLRATGSITYGPAAKTFCSDTPTDIRTLLDRNVILELDALTDAEKVFLVESLLLYVHHLRMAEPTREVLKHVLVVEEAHHVFLRAKQEAAGGEPITDIILREIRELGEAVVLVDQHPSQIAVTALGNTYCTIAMNLKHRADVMTVADACLLSLDEREHIGRLPVGAAIVKLQDRWASPFMVTFPLQRIGKGEVSDEVLRSLMSTPPSMERPGLIPIAEIPLSLASAREVSGLPDPPKDVRETKTLRDSEPLRTVLDESEERLLRDVADEPASGVTQRYGRLGLSRRSGTALKAALLRKALAREVPVPLPGGRITLLDLTADGWRALQRDPPPPRHGGVVHRFWIQRVVEQLRRGGLEVRTEAPVGAGQTIDVMADGEGDSVAVEVEVSGRRLPESIRKLIAADVTRRILLCASREVMEQATRLVPDAPGLQVLHAWAFSPRTSVAAGRKGTRS